MKKNTIFSIAFFAIIISLWACNETQDSQPISDPGPCHEQLPGYPTDLPFAYKKACAVVAINTYQHTIGAILDSLPNVDSNKMIYGAEVKIHELRAILMHHDANTSYDNLFVMLGISDGQGHVIFALQDTSNNDASSVQTQYFNFTLPCPSSCPREN